MKKRSRSSEGKPRVVATLSESALRGNYRALAKLAPGQGLLPMIKANAYGHGAVWAADVLCKMPGLRGFGVATLEEGIELRKRSKTPARVPVVVFSGVTPFTEERAKLCAKEGLTPVISSEGDWRSFKASPLFGRLRYELKFDTGMNRLGLPVAMAEELAKVFAKNPQARPAGVFSHLAASENLTGELSRKQLARFTQVRGALEGALTGTAFHLANSGAIWNSREWKLDELTDFVRPGLSLYGVPPWSGAPANGVKLVMAIEACVISTRTLANGESVGYGGTYQAGENGVPPGARVAILSVGYADGLHRGLSNKGQALLQEKPTRFAGIVSMDLSAVEVPDGADARVGEYVRVLGEGIEPWAQARLAGTIPYELLTSVSPRVQRRYVG
jgi:alanine racemase